MTVEDVLCSLLLVFVLFYPSAMEMIGKKKAIKSEDVASGRRQIGSVD